MPGRSAATVGHAALLAAAFVALAAVIARWADPRSALLAWNTLRLAAAVVAVSLPLGTWLAFVLIRADMPGRVPLLAVLGLLLFVPLYIQAAAWKGGFGLDGAFPAFHLGPAWLDGWPGTIVVHSAAAVPWVVLIVGIGLRLVEPDLEEEALLDGSLWQVFCRVTAPAALAAMGVAGLWVAVSVSGEMTVTDLFRVRTFAEELYTEFAIEPGQVPLAVLPGVAITAWLTLAALTATASLTRAERPHGVRRAFVFHLGVWRWPACVAAVACVIVLAGLPLASLAYKAGVLVERNDAGGLTRTWSPWKLVAIVARSPIEYADVIRWSAELGALAATTALLVGLPLAWLARRGGPRALPALLVTAFTLAVPGPLVGLGIIALLNRPESPLANALYDDLRFRPWLALSIRALPAALLVLWLALRSVPPDALDQAATEGAGPTVRFLRIAVPQRWAALAAAWLAAFAVTLGDLAASILVLPPGVDLLGNRIFSLVHSGVEDEVAGIALFVVLALAPLGAIAWRLVSRPGSSDVASSHAASTSTP